MYRDFRLSSVTYMIQMVSATPSSLKATHPWNSFSCENNRPSIHPKDQGRLEEFQKPRSGSQVNQHTYPLDGLLQQSFSISFIHLKKNY